PPSPYTTLFRSSAEGALGVLQIGVLGELAHRGLEAAALLAAAELLALVGDGLAQAGELFLGGALLHTFAQLLTEALGPFADVLQALALALVLGIDVGELDHLVEPLEVFDRDDARARRGRRGGRRRRQLHDAQPRDRGGGGDGGQVPEAPYAGPDAPGRIAVERIGGLLDDHGARWCVVVEADGGGDRLVGGELAIEVERDVAI